MKNKVIFICRDSVESRFIAETLSEKGYLDSLIIESGEIAKKKKINRMLKRNILMYPIIFINLVAIFIYNKISTNFIRSKFTVKYPYREDVLKIKDINQEQCVTYINKFDDPIIVIFGTAIIKKEFLTKTNRRLIINIHNGIVPNYRNVHSDFWAMYKSDYKNIGTTLMEVNEGVDTGNILDSKNISFAQGDNIFVVKQKNLILSGNLIVSYIDTLMKTDEPSSYTTQSELLAQSYGTPNLKDLILFFYRQNFND